MQSVCAEPRARGAPTHEAASCCGATGAGSRPNLPRRRSSCRSHDFSKPTSRRSVSHSHADALRLLALACLQLAAAFTAVPAHSLAAARASTITRSKRICRRTLFFNTWDCHSSFFCLPFSLVA